MIAKNLRVSEPWDADDVDGSMTSKLTEIAVQKAGFTLNSKDFGEMSKSELLSERGELRRLTNDFSDRADKALKAGDKAGAETALKHAKEISRWSALVSRQLDMLDMANESGRSGRSESAMTGSSGKRIHVLTKNDRLADTHAGQRAEFGFGEFVSAMVRGTDRLDVRNALSEGSDSAGGYTVPRFLMASVIDRMRARSVCVQAGALTVPLETQQTTIARVATDPLAGWRLENGAVAESDPTFEGVVFNARSLAVLVKISRELLDDSVNISQALTMAFAGAMAAELDRVALFGSGVAPEPKGIFNQTGVNAVSMGADGATPADYAKLLDCLFELELDNAAAPTAMVMHPRTKRTFAGFTDQTDQPLLLPPSIGSIPQLVSTNVPINQTQGGSGAVCSSVIMGDFTQLLFGIRQELRIEILRELFAEAHQYAFVAHLRADIAVAHPESFCKLTGVKA